MKKNILLIIFGLSCIVAKTQNEKFGSIYKLCTAGDYKEAVPKLYSFAKIDTTHIPAIYELGKIYKFWSDSIINEIKKNTALKNSGKIELYQTSIIYNDSAVFFLLKTSTLMNSKFLLTNMRYKEFMIHDVNLSDVECVRNYLNKLIKGLEDSQIKNKASLKTIKDASLAYDEKLFENYCKQTIIDQYKKDAATGLPGQLGDLSAIQNIKGLFSGLHSNEYIINSYCTQGAHGINYCYLIFKNNDSIWQNKRFYIDPEKYIDANNDGLLEILSSSGYTNQGITQGDISLVSLKNDSLTLLYSNSTFDNSGSMFISNTQVGDLISKNVNIDFKDINSDGIRELIETVTNGYSQSFDKTKYATQQTFEKNTNTYYLVNSKYIIKK